MRELSAHRQQSACVLLVPACLCPYCPLSPTAFPPQMLLLSTPLKLLVPPMVPLSHPFPRAKLAGLGAWIHLSCHPPLHPAWLVAAPTYAQIPTAGAQIVTGSQAAMPAPAGHQLRHLGLLDTCSCHGHGRGSCQAKPLSLRRRGPLVTPCPAAGTHLHGCQGTPTAWPDWGAGLSCGQCSAVFGLAHDGGNWDTSSLPLPD